MLAGRLAHYGVPSNPETWNVEAALISALNIHDAPGALLLGSHAQQSRPMQMDANDPAQLLDHIASDIVKTLPIGSSAGGEQPKEKTVEGDVVDAEFTEVNKDKK